MTNDQITSLAREYAEECIDPQGFSKETYEELVEEKAENVAYVLRWISIRFCLVSKEKINEAYQKALNQIAGGRGYDIPRIESYGTGKRNLLESLFPEIAKEVEP